MTQTNILLSGAVVITSLVLALVVIITIGNDNTGCISGDINSEDLTEGYCDNAKATAISEYGTSSAETSISRRATRRVPANLETAIAMEERYLEDFAVETDRISAYIEMFYATKFADTATPEPGDFIPQDDPMEDNDA